MTLVSIIIPVHNAAPYLERCLQSALSQTWEVKEIIVIDDGSTDGSLAIARSFEQSGITVISQEKKGAAAARNRGLQTAIGEWIQFLDADDFLREDKIALQLQHLEHENEVGICKTVHFFADDLSDAIPDDEVFYQAYLDDPFRFLLKLYGGFDYWGAMIQPNAFLVSRSIINKAGRWNEDLTLDDDGEFFCRVLLQAKKIRYSPEGLNFYRKYRRPASLSGSRSAKAFDSQLVSICLKHEHLLNACRDQELIAFVHTATYKAVENFLYSVYPNHKELYTKAEKLKSTLYKPIGKRAHVFGGALANFIGNKISWKLVKQLQGLGLKQKN